MLYQRFHFVVNHGFLFIVWFMGVCCGGAIIYFYYIEVTHSRIYLRNKKWHPCDISPFHGYYFLWWLFI